MKIVVDENIPFAQEILSQHGDVIAVDGRTMQAEQLVNVDALLVRSVTKVSPQLLTKANQLKFVGTATIGTEHIDQDYLRQQKIAFASAPGCNAIAVGEYVVTALLAAAEHQQQQLAGKTIAIVGAGNTGSQVAKRAAAIGMQVMLYDPPLAEQGLCEESVSFEQVLQADVISLHVPSTKIGKHPSYHMFNSSVLAKLKPEQVLLNACRGEVIDNQALLKQAEQGKAPLLILDVWEGEPTILRPLVKYAFIATPHIAGYSLEGKMRGTSMVYHAMCQALALKENDLSEHLLPEAEFSQISLNGEVSQSQLTKLTQVVYDIFADDRRFRLHGSTPQGFDQLRKFYPQRREFKVLQVLNQHNQAVLSQLGFNL
ncbi:MULTISPECIES: 4-phosphoerythronate dehydrogenase [unclassified Agarivorans]|uniref:4-phosphoerythronate dehydrogenase n=1 Tax=unclassified Agarivorans TaxID=2636026 RepID=UPI0026E14F6A|nr:MULTISPECIES: 4-phosphoerythronate dehydrogenase [unclassified Agarivorans]MDO6684760.1 4-phosphoerythronate dehydrogenase [Agarivorans sp. 3_MG-2023]MDO6715079.1 4-phosphoerythronate dehydrogenase [Agarivorans sp. 2_MG-2023]